MATEHHQDFLSRGAHHLADTYLLAAILRFKHRHAENTDKCNDDADDGEYQHLTNKAELLEIGFFQLLIK